MLSLLIYGYVTGTHSGRKIEWATYDSLAFRFIACDQHPDHATLALFRRRFGEPFAAIFVQVLQVARENQFSRFGTVRLDLFLRDDHPSYRISPELALAEFGVTLVPFSNAGLMRRRVEGIDLRECDRYLGSPSVSQPHWHLEQTLHALDASRAGELHLLPDRYAMSKGFAEHPDLVARHYVTPIRPLFVQEGVRHLRRTGLPTHLR